MADYIGGLEARLRDAGLVGQLLLFSSTGGTITAASAAAAPIHTLNSGPAMAPAAARDVVRRELDVSKGHAGPSTRSAVVFDSGGTTCDISLVRDGDVVHTRETWIGGELSGHITGFPSVEVHSIAAGGGSIARLDAEGLLHVGPDSAGAVPGPACYGRGGAEPTLTDACLLVGYLDPDTFLDGSMNLEPAAATAAMARIADPLGVDVRVAAQAVIDLATEQMVGAIESITLGKGIDTRRTPLVGGGGAAGLNIVAIARRLGSPVAIVPAFGATLSAGGGLMSPLVREFALTYPTSTDRFDREGVGKVIRELTVAATAFLAEHPRARGAVTHSVEARYSRQVWDLEVDHPGHEHYGDAEVVELAELFHRAHERAAGISDPDSPVECLTWRARAACARSTAHTYSDISTSRPTTDRRAVSFGSDGVHQASVVRVVDLAATEPVPGPAIVEGPATTVVVPPGATLVRTIAGHLIIDP
jgi:N-methylhydantoinase A